MFCQHYSCFAIFHDTNEKTNNIRHYVISDELLACLRSQPSSFIRSVRTWPQSIRKYVSFVQFCLFRFFNGAQSQRLISILCFCRSGFVAAWMLCLERSQNVRMNEEQRGRRVKSIASDQRVLGRNARTTTFQSPTTRWSRSR